MKRQFISLAAALCLALTVTACGGGSSIPALDTSSAESSAADTYTYADMTKLAADMAAADSTLPDMLTVTDADDGAEASFASIGDMAYDKIAHWLLVYSSEGKADEICVIAVNNAGDVKEAKDTLQKHADSRVRMYREYDASQAPRAEKAVIFTEGRYAVLIICDNADAVKAAFQAGIA